MSLSSLRLLALRNGPILLFIATFAVFGFLSDRFLQYRTLENILRQASYIGIVSVGMTAVIIAGGIDLSVGSLMYLTIAVSGIVVIGPGLPWTLAVVVCLAVGVGAGLVNGILITRFKMMPFVVTLGTLAVFRGLGLTFSKAQSVAFPRDFVTLVTHRIFGVLPAPILIFALVTAAGWLVLTHMPFGRHVHAVGEDRERAKKAGINVDRVTLIVYGLSGFCAALGGLVLAGQFGTVNADFGRGFEFDAIAAVVIGGASLFGGRGTVFPGTALGATLVQMINAGLIFARVDIYLQPLVFALVIYAAVLLDSQRTLLLARLNQRSIRRERVPAT